jgi:uncharacterized damage-inducible protein DinB
MLLAHVRRMAHYNHWANARLLHACAALSDDDYGRTRPAFFGSIHGTLNHMLVADRLWLARVEGEAAPHARLDETPWATFEAVVDARNAVDGRWIALADGLAEGDLDRLVRYAALTASSRQTSRLEQILLHVFNHATHHRGQIHDQLSQTEVPPPPLDLMIYLREAEPIRG